MDITLLSLELTYLQMLKERGALRHTSDYQKALCELRDSIAEILGIDSETIQNEYEART